MRRHRIIPGISLVLVLGVLLAACGWQDEQNERRGRGDAPVGEVVDEPVDVIQMPDRFSNVATACDGHGHRVYVTTQTDSGRFLAVIADPECV